MNGDRDMVIEAILADGTLADPGKAALLADDLLATQAQFLPRFS
jgi:alpha-galactosidase